MSLFDRLIEISTLEQLYSINNKLSCQNENKPEKVKTRTFRTARKYSEDPVKIKRRV
jgi:hypothetical protein